MSGRRNCGGCDYRGTASCTIGASDASFSAVSPLTGCLHSGAISARGPITNSRSAARGCGSTIGPPSSTVRPSAIRSRSSVRGALGAERSRPNTVSTPWRALSAASGSSAVVASTTPFRNGGSLGSGQAAERHQRDTLSTWNPASGRLPAAAASARAMDGYTPGRLPPRAITARSGAFRSRLILTFRILLMAFYATDRIALFVDGANLYSAAKCLNFDIVNKKQQNKNQKRNKLVRAYYYTAIGEVQD